MNATIINVDDVDEFTQRLNAAGDRLGRPDHRGAVEVPLLGLRQALLAVKPHAAGTKGREELQTLRILPGPTHCHIVATDQYTAALAAVRTAELDMTELDAIDLHVDDVAKVLAVFKMPADKDTWPDCLVRLTPRGNDLSITDAGGLFDGQELIVPAHTITAYPDVPGILSGALTGARGLAHPPAGDRGLPGHAVTKLAAAVKVYDEPAYLQPISDDPKASWLVLVGDRFIGMVSPATPPDPDDDGSTADWTPDRWRTAWATALPRSTS